MDDGSKLRVRTEQAVIPDGSVVLQSFIAKLGHHVEEIRVRALKNILFKLEHKLVCPADLVQERQLLINLLEWFNFPKAPLKKEVLGILEILSRPVSGAEGLLSLGAVEFLSHLRQDVDPELHQSVDNVIHQLLSLPQEDAVDHSQQCLYKEQYPGPVDQTQTSVDRDEYRQSLGQTAALPLSTQSTSTNLHPEGSRAFLSSISPVSGYFEKQGGMTQKVIIPLQSETHSESSSSKQTTGTFSDNKSSLTFVPWLPLSASDRHILSVTASRLQSRSSSLVSKSCEFLRDVLFKDFPAEIFLHRPSVLQSLLELLEEKSNVGDEASLTLGAIRCLCDLNHHVLVRLMAVCDLVLFCPEQDCWKYRHISLSMETKNQGTDQQVSNVRETGDGGVDSDDQSSSDVSDNKASQASDEDEDEMVTEALQFNQLSLEEFCIILLSKVVPIFKGYLCMDSAIIESAVSLSHKVLSLMMKVLPVDLWRRGTKLNSLMASSLVNIMKSLGQSIVHHIKYYGRLGLDEGKDKQKDSKPLKHTLPIHRMTVVNLATFLLQFLDSLVPLEISSKVVPSEVITVMWLLSMDELLVISHPHLRPAAMKYLAVLDPYSHELCIFTQGICDSMASTCKFLKMCRVKELSHSLNELSNLVLACVPSVTYHKHMVFISEAVKICSRVCNPASQADERAIPVCQKIVLQLLAHPSPEVRLQAYKISLSLVKEACSVSHVTEPFSVVCQKALFVLERAVLHQICCFGIYDADEKVCDVAVELITTLLLGRLSMSGELWKKLLDGLIASLPQLQGSILVDPALDQCILELVASRGATGGHVTAEGDIITLPSLERFRGALRLMFVKDSKVRSRAFESVVWQLTNQANSERRKSSFQGIPADNAADLFMVDQLTSAVHAHAPTTHTSVDKTEILNLLSILSSSSLDVGLRKSSAQQLAIILQDPQWHEPLLQEHADEVCMSILSEIVEQDAPVHSSTTPCPRVELIPACLTILRLLAEYSASCRRCLATKLSSYSVITRCSLLCQLSGQVKYEAACLMVLLLFDEAAVAVPDSGSGIPFSLPKSLVRRFISMRSQRKSHGSSHNSGLSDLARFCNLAQFVTERKFQFPFSPPVHTPISVHQSPELEEKDAFESEPAVSRLRLAWNLGWHENVDNLSKVKGVEDSSQLDKKLGYWRALQWTTLDADLLCCTHVQMALSNHLQCMETANSHYDVKIALSNITAHLLADKSPTAKQKLAVEVLYTLKWETAFERYLQVVPNSSDDDNLLIEVLKVLDIILSSPRQPPEPVVAWVARVVLQRDGPQMTLLRNVQTSTAASQTVSESKRALRKHLLSFLVTLVKCLSRYTKEWRLDKERIFIGDLAYALALNLDLADNPQFYDLPVLETSLVCLVHVTSQPRWSSDCKFSQGMSLCKQLMSSLVQVVLAFHAGRLGASLSFMGKGVTYYSSLCLLHLTHEMSIIDPEKAWVLKWSRGQDHQDESLPWLVPLLTDRWPDVRWMGLGVCTSLAGSEQGKQELQVAGQKFVGGLWSFVFTVLLDDMECGFVRQQAALLLTTLVSGLSPGGSPPEEKRQDDLKNPSKGIQDLHSLLENFKFFQQFSNMLTSSPIPLIPPHGTSKACQSSVTVSLSSGTGTDFPYKPLGSTSQTRSGSVSSEAQTLATESANGKASPGVFSVASHTSSTVLSGASSSAPETQLSRTPTSLVPLINERGLPSGMSSASASGGVSSSINSVAPSGTSSAVTRSSITPGLIGAMARLVNNLVLLNPGPIIAALNKAEILSSFIDHIDCTEVQGYLCVEEPTPLSCASAVVIQEILCMYSEILSFLHTVVKVNTIFCFTLLQDHKALDRIMLLFSLDASHTDDSLQIGVRTVRENACKLLITLLQNQGQLSVPSVVEETLLTHWRLLISVTKHSFEESKSPALSSLRILLLKLLGLQLTIEGKRQPNGRGWSNGKSDKPLIKNHFTRLLDNTDTSEHLVDAVKNEKNHREQNCEYGPGFSASSETSGQELCSVLLEVYDSAPSRQSSLTTDQEQALVCAVLSALLALSHAAKRIALQAGLVETTLEHVKHLHAQMNMNSLQLGKGSSWRRKEDPLMIELIKVLQLLRNFLHCNASVKRACVESRIVDVLHKLWSWCSVEVHLLNEVLRLLSTLTAQFSKASAYVAGSSGVLGNVSRSVQSGSTLLHSLIKLTHKTNSKLQNSSSTELDMHLAVLKNMFNLLSNLALSAECRGVLWKTNFFQPFASLKPIKSGAHPRHKSITRGVTLCWLNVLVSVTFFTDGQQVVVKTPGVVEVLLELSMAQNRQLQEKALLVLRNLCFHGASKPVLLVNEKLLSLLVEFTTDNSVYLRALCLSALCSLLHNCQKAKVSLKKTGLVKKLDEIHLLPEFEHATEDKFSKMCQENINILRKIFSDKDDRAV